MSIRMTVAAVAAAFAVATFATVTTAPAEAGGLKRAAKAAPAPRAECGLRAMMSRIHARMHERHHAKPAKAVKVAKAEPKKAAPKK